MRFKEITMRLDSICWQKKWNFDKCGSLNLEITLKMLNKATVLYVTTCLDKYLSLLDEKEVNFGTPFANIERIRVKIEFFLATLSVLLFSSQKRFQKIIQSITMSKQKLIYLKNGCI